jgi:hypothetical protein
MAGRCIFERAAAAGFAVALVVSTGAAAQAADPPLFAAFKAFCVATGARPDAIKQAVEAAGGTLFRPTNTVKDPPPESSETTATVWSWAVGSYAMKISAVSLRRAPADAGDFAHDCMVRGEAKDDASVEAIRKWVGVAPDPNKAADPAMSIFNFEERAGVRSSWPDSDAEMAAARTEGRVWRLNLYGSDRLAGVRLTHLLAAPGPNGPNRPQPARP